RDARRPHLFAWLSATPCRGRPEAQTHSAARLRVRRQRRARYPHHRAVARTRAELVSHTDTATGREQILAELSLGAKFLLTTHENPDGDALGSLLAMHEILKLMGKDSIMFMSAEEFPL